MFSHIMVGADDIDVAKVFYDALLAVTGGNTAMIDDKGRLFYMHNNSIFAVTKPIDGNAASRANGGTIGFAMNSPQQVNAWHAAGVAAGGTTCEDPPGIRSSSFGDLYLAYLRDPSGNKLCGMYRPV